MHQEACAEIVVVDIMNFPRTTQFFFFFGLVFEIFACCRS